MKQFLVAMITGIAILFAVTIKSEKIKVAKFGEVEVFRRGREAGLGVFVIYESSEWHGLAADIGRSIAKDQNVAVLVDLDHYLKASGDGEFCQNITGDLDELNKSVQKSLDLKHPVPVVLLGKDVGANAVELAFNQTGDETFGGFIAIAPCPDTQAHTLCKVERNLPSHSMHRPFFCAGRAAANENTMTEVMKAHHDLQRRAWVEAIKDRLYAVAPRGQSGNSGLATLEIFPAEVRSDRLVVIYSGDGGWATFVQNLSGRFSKDGIPVVGVDSLKYFWSKKTPEESARDLEALLQKYTERFHSRKVQLIGFSQGADVLPFIVNSLPPARQAQIDRVSLLSIGVLAEFEFHLDNWISREQKGTEIMPEVLKMATARIDCVFGQETEAETICPTLKMKNAHTFKFSGGHFMNWDTAGIYRKIAE